MTEKLSEGVQVSDNEVIFAVMDSYKYVTAQNVL